MGSNIISALEFEEYSIENMVFKKNINFNSDEEEIELEFKFDAKISVSEEKNSAVVSLTCKIFDDDFTSNEVPFFLEICIRGHFKCGEKLDIEQFKMNGIAILLPYLRAVITSFTSQAGIEPIVLPAINIYNLFKKPEKEDN